MLLEHYKKLLDYENIPEFLNKYIIDPKLLRLSKVGYFCGMDFASKNVYNFSEKITRYDHSITTALLTWKLTHDKKATLAALFHDISTPCFSHVIDYMNKDYEKQESTEEYTLDILNNDEYLKECLYEDDLDINDIANFKEYSVVDNDRPKLCADRLDGIILSSISWTKTINADIITDIIDNICIFKNEDDEYEIGFTDEITAERVVELNNDINNQTHSDYDNYMMQLLANITRYAIEHDYILYEDLYVLNEKELFDKLYNIKDKDLMIMLSKFRNINLNHIPKMNMDYIKDRTLNPLVNGKRSNKKIAIH